MNIGPDPAPVNATGSGGLEPDLGEAAWFLTILDPDAERFTFQTFDDVEDLKRGHLAKVIHDSLEDAAERLTVVQRARAGVFVTVNETDLRGRKAANIVRVRAVWCDLDGSQLQPIMGCKLEPHVVVESSPGRWHCYWIVDGLPLDRFAPVQKAIAARFGGDKAVSDLPRVMRMPGFWHQKGEPFRSRVHGISDRMPYTAAEIFAEFPAGATAAKAANGHAEGAEDALDLAELVRQVMTTEAYHGPLLRLAWRYLGSGMSKRQATLTLQGLLLAVPEPHDARWQARFDDIARLVESAETKQEEERASAHTARVEDLAPAPVAGAPAHELVDDLDPMFRGPLGDAVDAVWDLTEADPRGIMAALLTMFGNWIGREFYVAVGADRHVPTLFTLLVGPSGTGRKGTAVNIAKLFMRVFDPAWEQHNIFYALNSGQGIVHTVRNLDRAAREPQGSGGGIGDGDRRALFCIAEFGDVMAKAEMPGNTLLDMLRDCWDSGALENNSVTHNARVRGAAVSLIGMTTYEDLIERIDLRELATGTLNRMLLIQVDRSRVLPGNPPLLAAEHVKDAAAELRANITSCASHLSSVGYVGSRNRSPCLRPRPRWPSSSRPRPRARASRGSRSATRARTSRRCASRWSMRSPTGARRLSPRTCARPCH